jgi:drug/metabolite transporter (DMT)-like permease
MWLLYAIIHMFLMALVNYLDEWLTHSSSTQVSTGLHERIGGVLIMSTLMTSIGLAALYTFGGGIALSQYALLLSLASAIPYVLMWAGYFYLFQTYSAHQVVPLFGLSSIWLLAIELIAGASIGMMALAGIIILIVGAYLLDNGSLKWKTPSKLFFSMVFLSLCWALAMFSVKLATENDNPIPVFFWQMVGILLLGIILFIAVKPYRDGFIGRIKKERSRFIGPSLMNESISQTSFLFATLAVTAAPLAVYFTASGGIQSIFLLALFYFFPLDKRNNINLSQTLGVVGIALGIALLEFGK